MTEISPLWRAGVSKLEALGLADPYWAYAWAGGVGLARYVLDHPRFVAGKRVLDFATGCGVSALAASIAGAGHVRATEIDPLSLEAADLNAQLNGVALELVLRDVIGDPCDDIDVVLAGDVFYETALAERCMVWLVGLAQRGTQVLIGDPGRAQLPADRLALRARYTLLGDSAIEDEGVRRSNVYALAA